MLIKRIKKKEKFKLLNKIVSILNTISADENMNTPVKRAKSTALGIKCNPSRDPTKYRKGAQF